MNVDKYIDKAVELAIEYVPKLVLAIVVLIVGLMVIKFIVKTAKKAMKKNDLDATLSSFLGNILSALLKVALLISIAGLVGVETTSLLAILGAAGLAIGLALQGSLANFAGSALIMLFRPFKAGDFIETQGQSGTVAEIQIFHTVLRTGDNRIITVPNGAVANGSITNFSAMDTRRVDFVFGIGYDDDIDQAKAILERLVTEDARILKDPAHFIAVKEMADSSVNFVVRAWAKSSDYWGIYFDMQEKVKKAFDAEGVSIPFPQRDVHIYQESK
jgi:small conductance mechanosensitive channel